MIQLKAGVVLAFCRSWTRPSAGLSRFATWLASQLVPPPGGSLSGGETELSDCTAPVSDSNQGNGKCLATYWSFGCAPVSVVTSGLEKSPAMLVGLVSGLLSDAPGPAQVASSRPTTESAWYWVAPGTCSPPMSWA